MSAHVEEQLWSFARGELGPAQAKVVTSHLAECASCRRVSEQFHAAVPVVKPAEPPVLDDAAWSRVDSKVMAAARAQLGRRSPLEWFAEHLRALTAFGALATAAALLFLFFAPKPVNTPENARPVEVALPMPLPAPVVPPVQQQPLVVEPEAVARLASVSKANVGTAALSSGQGVKLGDRLETGAGGRAFLQLPDGSRAGVVGEAGLTLAAASVSEVHLTLERGTLVVAAAHAGPERRFKIAAGQVEVFVVGTRFLVERAERTTVVVEEGLVEVAVGADRHAVSAGETLIVDTAGKITRTRAITPAARAAFQALQQEAPATEKQAAAQPRIAHSAPSENARLTDEDDVTPPVEGGLVEQRADAGSAVALGTPTPPPLLIPGEQSVVAAKPPPEEEKKKFDLLATLKRIDLKNINLDAPYPPVGMEMSEYRVHQLQRGADRGQCDRVVERADGWVSEFGADPKVKNRPALMKAVLFTKARCLTKLGRSGDAEKARQQAEAVR